jgi:hypothetical protein
VVAWACAVAPGAALASDSASVTHASGAVSATLQWDGVKDSIAVANPRLAVTRAGTPYDLKIADICEDGCILVADSADRGPGDSIVKVVDLDGDGEPEVLVDTFSGGAHCCTTTRVFTWNGTGYASTDIGWADATYAVKDANGDGHPDLVGQDAGFAYAFTSYADSAFPPLVRQVDHGKVTDITKQCPALIKANASKLLKALRKASRSQDIRGILGAYVADQYLLGKASVGQREIAHQRAKGRISKSFGPFLLKTLKKMGYR